MIIITNGTTATMYYTESQWLDAEGADFGEGAYGYRVPNSSITGPILGAPEQVGPEEGGTLKIIAEATEPMSQEEVEAIATEVVLKPSLTKD
jgi:hypothetical protein